MSRVKKMLLGFLFIAMPPLVLAQALDQETVHQMVSERMADASRTYFKVNGISQAIDDGEMGPSEDGFVMVFHTDPDAYIFYVDPLISQGQKEAEIKAVALDPSLENVKGEGKIMATAEDTDGNFSITLSGDIEMDDGSIRQIDSLLTQNYYSRGSTKIKVLEDRFVLSGTLGFGSYAILQEAIAANPNIKILEITDAPGSVDDEINVQTGRLVRAAGLNTYVRSGSEIASGAVDLFASGVERIAEEGAMIGVHSWCCSETGQPVAELPKDDPAHAALLSYSIEMLGEEKGPEFYFFTLNAAPAEDVYFMSSEELLEYGLATELR